MFSRITSLFSYGSSTPQKEAVDIEQTEQVPQDASLSAPCPEPTSVLVTEAVIPPPDASIPTLSFTIDEAVDVCSEYEIDDISTAVLEINGPVHVSMSFLDLRTGDQKAAWLKIFDEDDPSTTIRLDANAMHGQHYIEVGPLSVTFVVSRSLDDGSMAVTVPTSVALPTLRKCYEQWVARKAQYPQFIPPFGEDGFVPKTSDI